jgi:hypothetical protein
VASPGAHRIRGCAAAQCCGIGYRKKGSPILSLFGRAINARHFQRHLLDQLPLEQDSSVHAE